MRAPDSDLPIVLENVRYAVRAVSILENVSLTFSPGTPTVVIGPNGAGKTTLLNVAMGLIVPSAGRVSWGGHGNRPPLHRALVRQRPTMLRRSTAANIRYALASGTVPRNDWPKRISELLDLVGLSGLAERPARRLSGGEQQRLALARALARDPQVLFLDEPTASLDPAATKAIEDLVRAIAARNIKVVMSTHDLGQARRLAGDIVFMHRGRLVKTGAAAEFFANPRTEEARRFITGELLL